MAEDKLKDKLNSIETSLGGVALDPQGEDKLGAHLDYIESLIQSGGTTLYKHTTTLGGQFSQFWIVSTNSEVYTSSSDVRDECLFGRLDGFQILELITTSTTGLVIYYSENGTIKNTSITINDTVTPLE